MRRGTAVSARSPIASGSGSARRTPRARTGGEEFIIVLDDVGNLEDVERVADDVLVCLGVPHAFEGSELRMSASIGIALYPDDGNEPLSALEHGRCRHVSRQARWRKPALVLFAHLIVKSVS